MTDRRAGERVVAAVKRARAVLEGLERGPVAKTIWGSPAGKKQLAKKLVALLPEHRTYVEPFAGSAAVLFEKEPAEVEVLGDFDPEIAAAFQIAKRLSQSDIDRLRRKDWTGDEGTYRRLRNAKPKDDVGKLHRFLYLSRFSYGKFFGKSFDRSAMGKTARSVERVEKFAPRLKKVRVYGGDYEKIVRQYDGPDTVFFLDPPYAGYDAAVGESAFDEERFFGVLSAIKGKFLLTYGARGKLPALVRKAGYSVRRINTPRALRTIPGAGAAKALTQLVVANYDLKKAEAPTFEKNVPLIKGAEPGDERYVLGVVLEPEVVDAQNEIYSAEEVRRAAHRFMEDFGGLGVMHRFRVNDQVKLLESFIAPAELTIGGVEIRKGTWLIAVRVLSDALWEQVKDGRLGGFSVGGSSLVQTETSPAADQKEEPS